MSAIAGLGLMQSPEEGGPAMKRARVESQPLSAEDEEEKKAETVSFPLYGVWLHVEMSFPFVFFPTPCSRC